MSQNDFSIANQTFPNTRSDLNDALQALASLSSGSSAPSTTYANMLWYDTANNILKMRTEADDAWINVAYLDQSSDAFRILDDTQVVNTSGTQTGLLGDQTTSAWETGTATTESLVSPAKVKAAIDALGGAEDTYGAIGSHVFAYTQSKNVAIAPGDTIAGSALYPAGQAAAGDVSVPSPTDTYRGTGDNSFGLWNTNASYALSGTWRALGVVGAVSTSYRSGTLFVRIS